MIKIAAFTFNPFQENTYILYDESRECVIIDPGCYSKEEKEAVVKFIETENLKPVKIILTHAHLDHILGNKFLCEKYSIEITMHESEIPLLKAAPVYSEAYGVSIEPSPDATIFIDEGD